MHPFPYFGHGLGTYNNNFYLNIWFDPAITKKQIKLLIHELSDNPDSAFVGMPSKWHKHTVMYFIFDTNFKLFLLNAPQYNESADDNFPSNIGERFGVNTTDVLGNNKSQLLKFNYEVDETLIRISKKFPLKFCINVQSKKTLFSSWHQWSMEQIDDVLEQFKKYFQAFPPTVIESYDRVEMSNPAVVLTELLSYYLTKKSFIQKLSDDKKTELYQIIKSAFGYDGWTDTRLFSFLKKLNSASEEVIRKDLPINFQTNFAKFTEN